MHLVHHKERYNYLKMSYVDQKGQNQILNPLFALNFKAIRQDKQLPDIKLLPEDCIQAIEILKDVKSEHDFARHAPLICASRQTLEL